MRRTTIAVVALLFAVTVQLLRASGPLLDQVAGPVGIVNAALIALGVFAVPGIILHVLGRRYRREPAPALVQRVLARLRRRSSASAIAASDVAASDVAASDVAASDGTALDSAQSDAAGPKSAASRDVDGLAGQEVALPHQRRAQNPATAATETADQAADQADSRAAERADETPPEAQPFETHTVFGAARSTTPRIDARIADATAHDDRNKSAEPDSARDRGPSDEPAGSTGSEQLTNEEPGADPAGRRDEAPGADRTGGRDKAPGADPAGRRDEAPGADLSDERASGADAGDTPEEERSRGGAADEPVGDGAGQGRPQLAGGYALATSTSLFALLWALALWADRPGLLVVAAAAVFGLASLGLAARCFGDPVGVTIGLLAGGGLDLMVRSATVTLDPIWSPEDAGWIPTTALVVLTVGLAVVVLLSFVVRDRLAPMDGTGRTWVLGGYLAVWTTTVGNPAFVASQSGVALQLCVAISLFLLLNAVELVRRLTLAGGTDAIPEPDHWIAGSAALAGLTGGLALAWWTTGWLALVGVVLAQLSATVAVARGLASPSTRFTWAYGLIWVLPVLLFQVHYDMPLPFDNRWLLLGLGVLVGLGGMGRRPGHPGGPWRVDVRGIVAPPSLIGLSMALAMAVPALMHITQPPPPQQARPALGLRVMSWNIKYGRDDASGAADPRQLAAAIRASYPDVVLLQEVSRGWAIGGGVDVAEYLSRELNMRYYWSPAADGQFGNLLLTRLPVRDVRYARLPYGQGPMWRSVLKASVTLDSGLSLDVFTAHLTHRKPNTPTRLAQIDAILSRVDPSRPTVIAGDFNFWPSWSERDRFVGSGWVSAQDATGHSDEWTSPTDVPTNRVDWLFGSPQVAFLDFAVLNQVTASDHFPILAVIRLR
ncbi:endonuclease/exonuclease/phosphatase family protein [Catellatospora tritici]|uniref:endonuclease/exonuclease/phosphatase family protein n=1 Tax=Catellatospora tritici TaxID=2851566 RepID=UPI001C2DAE88|nr:endonuclease/exonuclease/phosphatase family protein [Catellatospora tritici]MBV1855435.1 endonuclease/exonuclease/phosphatase family protein [Catellatospora tritici]